MSKNPNWITEKEAAEILQYHPRYLRSLVKKGTLDISYTNIRGKRYHYDERQVKGVLNTNAHIIK